MAKRRRRPADSVVDLPLPDTSLRFAQTARAERPAARCYTRFASARPYYMQLTLVVPGLLDLAETEPARADAEGAALARLLAGEHMVSMMTQVRAGSNAKAKRELDWQPAHPSWRQGFAEIAKQSPEQRSAA